MTFDPVFDPTVRAEQPLVLSAELRDAFTAPRFHYPDPVPRLAAPVLSPVTAPELPTHSAAAPAVETN